MENVNEDRAEAAALDTAAGSPLDLKTGNGTTLDSIVERVTDLGNACTYDDAKQITAEAVRADLPRSALDHLVDVFVDYTNFKAGPIRSMIKEAKNTSDDYGELHSLGATSRAFVGMLERDYDAVNWNGDSLYVFSASDRGEQAISEEAGFFRRVLPHELDATLQADFAHLSFMERDSARKEVIKQIATRLQQDDFFADAIPGVCVANGFLSFSEDGQLILEPHSVAQRARVKLAFTFDEQAGTSWVEEGFAVTLTDQTKLRALQEALGATVFNLRVSSDEARRMVILYGPRRSGKSTVLDVLQRLFPVEAVTSVPPNEWGREYSRAQLEGKALNIATELGADMRIPAEQLKKIASCETVTARHPYGRQFTFTPSAWHWFATNELPRTTDKTNAFERRLLCLGFDRSLGDGEIDPTFVSRIFENPSALLRWVAEGAKRLLERGKFVLPHDHEEACARMQHGFNIPAIVAARIERAPGQRIWSSELKAMAARVAEELGMMTVEVGPGELKAIVHELRIRYGAERRMTAGRPFYEHVQFRREELSVVEVASAEESELSAL